MDIPSLPEVVQTPIRHFTYCMYFLAGNRRQVACPGQTGLDYSRNVRVFPSDPTDLCETHRKGEPAGERQATQRTFAELWLVPT